MKNDIIIYSYKKYCELLKMGYKVKDIRPNINYPHLNVFVFEYDERLLNLIKKWKTPLN